MRIQGRLPAGGDAKRYKDLNREGKKGEEEVAKWKEQRMCQTARCVCPQVGVRGEG